MGSSRRSESTRASSGVIPYNNNTHLTSEVANALSTFEIVSKSSSSSSTRSATRLIKDENEQTDGISLLALKDWGKQVQREPVTRLAQTVLSRIGMGDILTGREARLSDVQVFNAGVTLEGNPVANQKNSGRCWLFACTNVIRTFVARKYKLDNFQLSQSYLFVYDHLSKANWFLEQMLDLADEPLDAREVQFLMNNSEAQDGGQYDMAVALIETFGLVPQTIYPESFNSSSSAELDTLLTSKLREYCLELRELYAKYRGNSKDHDAAVEKCREVKDDQLKEIFKILAITNGTPPHPNEKFVWEFIDTTGTYRKIITTPLDFASPTSLGYDVSATVSIINDPRHRFDALYTVQRLGNVVGGRELKYINVKIEELKKFAIRALKADYPVWFGCDVDKATNFDAGVMDTALYNYDDAFGTTLGLNKADRLRTGDSSMTHAMMLTAVHLDANGNPVRWRVENSWGPDACTKGFLCMNDDWFTENVFQIVAPRKFVDADLLRLYDTGKVVELPPWDPMGALA